MQSSEPFLWAVLLRPIGFLLLMAVIVIPLEIALAHIWPEGRLKRILFDRTFRDRHPWIYFLVGIPLGLVVAVLVLLFLVGVIQFVQFIW